MSTRKGNSFSWGCGLKLANDCYLYIIIKIIIILAECCLIIKDLYNCFYLSYSRHYLPNERTDWQQGYLVPDQSLLIILPHYQLSLTVIIKFWRRKKSWRERERERESLYRYLYTLSLSVRECDSNSVNLHLQDEIVTLIHSRQIECRQYTIMTGLCCGSQRSAAPDKWIDKTFSLQFKNYNEGLENGYNCWSLENI